MKFFDFFKKKKKPKEEKKKESVKVKPLHRVKKPLEKKEGFKLPIFEEKAGGIKPEIRKPKKKISEKAYQVLSSPHITEKATILEKDNKYVFKIRLKTNKTEIKRAVEDIYRVDVVGVKIINIPKKRRRLGRQIGWRKGYKKAIIEIKKGQKIEILSR